MRRRHLQPTEGTLHSQFNLQFTALEFESSDNHNEQEAQLMLTNLRDAFRGKTRSPNYHSIRYTFLLCNSNFVLRRAVIPIINFQKCLPWNQGQIECGTIRCSMGMVSYRCSIVTLSLRRTVFNLRYSNCKYTEMTFTGLGVTQGHRIWYQSIRHPWLSINVPL